MDTYEVISLLFLGGSFLLAYIDRKQAKINKPALSTWPLQADL